MQIQPSLVFGLESGQFEPMRPTVQVTIHSSQFPEDVQRALSTSLRTRRVNHKFLYDGVKKTQKWLALHEAYSPARSETDCVQTYERAFAAATRRTLTKNVHVIGLGCGGGQKDAQLLRVLKRAGRQPRYSPCDVSLAMVLAAGRTTSRILGNGDNFPVVCDLAEADDLAAVWDAQCSRGACRLLTFFGMLPNFEPQIILPRLGKWLRAKDWLLLSANLAPGPDYAAGVRRILPQYNNARTRDWLMTFLLDLGVERTDGEFRFSVQTDPSSLGLRRVVAEYRFKRTRRIQLASETIAFHRGNSLRVFFSYRYTPDRVRRVLDTHGIAVADQWITRSEEEGVFLCQRVRRSGW